MRTVHKSHFNVFCIFLLCSAGLPIQMQAPTAAEHEVKAAYIYNFTQFVTWPNNAFNTTKEKFRIGIYGSNPFGNFLEQLVANEKVNGREIQIVYATSHEEAITCHILYISHDARLNSDELLKKCISKQILTIGDSDWFMRQGGILRFVTVENKVRFQINPQQAELAGLQVSSKVLRLAEIVEPKRSRR